MRQFDKFKEWFKYTPPYALSSSGWRLFNDEFKLKAPIRYFLYHRLPKFWRPLLWAINDFRDWIKDRTTQRTHVVNTGLKPGYHGLQERLLHANFSLLKDYVEKEAACYYEYWQDQVPSSWFKRKLHYLGIYCPNPANGIKYLEWASNLDDPKLPIFDQDPTQATTARETMVLYKWWTEIRPNRSSGIPDADYSDQGFEMGPIDDDFDKTAADYVNYRIEYDKLNGLSEKYEIEDDEMLHRLIKIYKELWV